MQALILFISILLSTLARANPHPNQHSALRKRGSDGFQWPALQDRKTRDRAYDDFFDDYLQFLEPGLVEARRVLATMEPLFPYRLS